MSNSGFTKVSHLGGHLSDLNVSDLKVDKLAVNELTINGNNSGIAEQTVTLVLPSNALPLAPGSAVSLYRGQAGAVAGASFTGSGLFALPANANVVKAQVLVNGATGPGNLVLELPGDLNPNQAVGGGTANLQLVAGPVLSGGATDLAVIDNHAGLPALGSAGNLATTAATAGSVLPSVVNLGAVGGGALAAGASVQVVLTYVAPGQ